jgi:hypothetical protein
MYFIIGAIIRIAIMMAISYAVSRALQKKPPSIKLKPNEFQVPTIEEGSKFPVIFGTCWVENPVLGWWGDTKAESNKIRIDDSGGQYMYFYKYYHGAHHIIAQGFCDGILQIKVGDNLVWPNSADKYELAADAESSAVINLPDLYGGISTYHGNVTLGGGLTGTVDLEYGATTQPVNDYLESVQGSYISANRGLTGAVLRQIYVGTDPNIQTPKYLVKRTAHLTTGETQWYPEKATIRDYEINPIHLIRECYTNPELEIRESTARFNDTIWKAAADTLYNEGFGMSIKWDGNQSLEDFINEVKEIIEAEIYEDPETGEFVIKLIRDDYTVGDLEEFDNTDIVKITEFSRGAMYKIPDVTWLEYWNMYDNLPVVTAYHDMALTNNQGEMLIPNEISMTCIVNDGLAGQLAAREQNQLSAFPAIGEMQCKRTMSHLNPGDVFKLVYPPLGIVLMIIRVLDVKYGVITDNAVTITWMEDIFGMKSALYATPPFSGWYNSPQAEAGAGINDYPTILYNAITDEMLINQTTGNIVYKDV